MACSNPEVPDYLHWDQKTRFQEKDFKDEQLLHRVGNPITFPSTLTAYSCKWSFLIEPKDILKGDSSKFGTEYCSAAIKSIKAFKLEKHNETEGEYIGFHKLSCILDHAPRDCDFSHSEILIKHQIFRDVNELEEIFCEVYTYEKWQTENIILKGKRFYKTLRSDYRLEITKLFLLSAA